MDKSDSSQADDDSNTEDEVLKNIESQIALLKEQEDAEESD